MHINRKLLRSFEKIADLRLGKNNLIVDLFQVWSRYIGLVYGKILAYLTAFGKIQNS